jgi:hypothetical protein
MLHLLLAADPSVPNDVGGKYVAGAYVVFIVLLLVYVAIMAMKLARIERGLGEVAEIAEARNAGASAAEPTEAPVPTTTHTVTPGPAASGATAQETRP